MKVRRRMAALAIASGLALATLGAPALAPVLQPATASAATPGLTVAGATTYDAVPAQGKVTVSSVLTVTNHLKDTVTKRLYFRTAIVTVLPGTSGFKLTGGSSKPRVSVAKRTSTYVNLKIDFGANLAAGRTTTLTLTFDLKDPGGAPDRPVRISPSLLSFAAWAIAAPGTTGGSVVVRLPTGYTATIGQGPLTGPVDDGAGHEVYSSGPLQNPTAFVADVTADRPTDYAETTESVTLDSGTAQIVIRSWPDDTAWRDRIGGLVERALPVLERDIGVPYRLMQPLVLHEALARSIGGNEGVFDPTNDSIDIAYAASDGVVLHELAHAWFNGGLVADQWAAEGFAAYYAGLAATALGITAATPSAPTDSGSWAIPLNAWGPAGTVAPQTDEWAAAAAFNLAQAIATRAGPDAMHGVWLRAAQGIGAYETDRTPETTPGPPASPGGSVSPPPDWRGLLDLLEEGTGRSFTDLWLQWVARPADVQTLADRAATRGWYLRSIALAGSWQLPQVDLDAMRAWRFDAARGLLSATDAVTAQRISLEQSAAAAKLTLPDTLRSAFEGSAGIAAAAAEATREQATVDAIVSARAAQPTETGAGELAIIAVGLLGADPAGEVASAVKALAAGDVQQAYVLATDASGTWTGAAGLGRSRIVSVLLLLVALALVVGLVRQQRRRSRVTGP